MSLTILRVAVDTLDASFVGAVRPHVLGLLHDAKLKAQETEEPQYAPLGGLDFCVSAQGAKPYKYKLIGDEASIRATDSDKLPGASIHLSALGLAIYEPLPLYELLHEIVRDCLGPEGAQKISRFDVAVDFQGFDVAKAWLAEELRFTCPAIYRPVFPSTDNPQTFMFGNGDVVVRVYNKTREIQVSRKQWTEELWKSNPEYRPGEDVWRFEVQLRRKALLELGCDTPQEALASVSDLLAYGLSWCDGRIPHGKSSDRWERHDAWKQLAAASEFNTLLTRQALKARLASLENIVPAVAGYAISAGAALDLDNFDEVWAILQTKVRNQLEYGYTKAVRMRRLERLG